MPPDPIDVEFVRFQRTRSPDALAAVFDAAAPRLLLVAMHLCREASAAEDLVQTVFLQALRDVDRFDASRPVLPWLLTILEHRATDLGRHITRRRDRMAIDELRDATADPGAGPPQAALDAEVRQEVAAAISSLPSDYRELLALRLVHGLRAIDIAHAKGLPPATVRTRLRRGLLRLRQALPRGLAAPLLTAWLATETARAGQGLPAVRANLLRALGTGAATAAGAGLGKWLVGAGIALLIAIATVALAPATFLPGPAAPAAPPGSALQSAPLANVDAPPPDRRTDPPLRADDRALATGRPASTATTVHGRVVRRVTGTVAAVAPLASCTIELQTETDGTRGPTPADWSDPPPVRTGDDGRFEFTFEPPPALSFRFGFQAPHHVPTERWFDSLRTGIDADLGDIELEPGTPVQVRITLAGQPQAGLEIRLARLLPGDDTTDVRRYGPSDATGRIEAGLCAVGRWRCKVQSPLRENTVEFDLPLQSVPFTVDVDLRLPPPDCLVTGRVVDQAEQPVAGLSLRVPVPGSRFHGYWPVTTDADGRFLLSQPTPWPGTQRFTFELPPTCTDLTWIDDGGAFAWGTQDLRLVVRRRVPGELRLTVVDARTGAALEEYGASCLPDPWRLRSGEGQDHRAADVGAHPGGKATFASLPPGPYLVAVFPPAPFAERTALPIDIAEGIATQLRVEVAPAAELRVLVVDAATGEPMPGLTVTLAQAVPGSARADVDLDTYRVRAAEARAGRGGSSTGTHVLLLDEATSDGDGAARLHAAADTPAVLVLVEGGRCVPQMVRDVRLPAAGDTLRVPVQAAGELTGIVRPPAIVQAFAPVADDSGQHRFELPDPARFADEYPEVRLVDLADPERTVSCHVDAEGRFRFGSLVAGRYSVSLQVVLQTSKWSQDTQDLGSLATVTIAAGRSQTLELDATAQLPGRVSCRVFVDGAPWHGLAGFVRMDGAGENEQITDADGALQSDWLPAGRYLAFARSGRFDCWILSPQPIDVTPGTELSWTADLHRRSVTIDLRTADGQPLKDRRVVLEPLDHPGLAYAWRHGATTDGSGRLVFDVAPPGRLAVHAFGPEQDATREDELPAVRLGELSADEDAAALRWPR